MEPTTVTTQQCDMQAAAILADLPAGPRVAAIGSGTFRGRDSGEICDAVGFQLAHIAGLVMITGGLSGVGEAVGRSFCRTRKTLQLATHTYQVLPHGCGTWDYGVTVYGGETMEDRREILGRLAGLYVSIEGGPGTEHEARVAETQGATIIPIARTGGFSETIYRRIACPQIGIENQWELLDDNEASIEELSVAVSYIVREVIRRAGVGSDWQ